MRREEEGEEEAEEEGGGEEEEKEARTYARKSKNPTARCGEKTYHDYKSTMPNYRSISSINQL